MYMISGLIAVRVVTGSLSTQHFEAWLEQYGLTPGMDGMDSDIPDVTVNDLPPSYSELFSKTKAAKYSAPAPPEYSN